jgi:diguanylate cyclase (GGDEF)-like protein
VKILLVDDARSVVLVMTSRLRSYGHEVVTAENGQAAVEKFRLMAPDLILMDVEMPVMNGFDAASHIRALEAAGNGDWTPIIFLTSSDTVDNLITAIEAGGDDFMSKLVPEPVLQAKMKAMTRIAGLRETLAAANRKLEQMANLDGLTGLCNRRSLDRRIDALWAEALQGNKAFGLLMIDIDNFKKYNDHYGHQEGDQCLRDVARALESAVEQCNAQGMTRAAFVARYGGEEFTVVLPDASPDQAVAMGELALTAVSDLAIAHEKNDIWGIVTISIGAAVTPQACGLAGVVFRDADAQLYASKGSGRNRFSIAG